MFVISFTAPPKRSIDGAIQVPPRRVRLLGPARRHAAAHYSNAITELLSISAVFLPSTTNTPPAMPPPPPKPQPKECLSSFMKLLPCNEYLHNYSLPKPTNPGKCCDGIRSLNDDTPICFCHYYPDVLSNLMPPKVVGPSFASLPYVCNVKITDISCDGKLYLPQNKLVFFCALLCIYL